MNNLDLLIDQLRTRPEKIDFQHLIGVIDDFYHYTPTSFRNGISDETITNDEGTNEGSCKIFSFAQLHDLDKEQTLQCFGNFYREDVLKNPGGNDHDNIRTFMKFGWQGIKFDRVALVMKKI
ncbi:MAG TPA: type III effector [Gammaproteobacteria bacterium]|nr:type III effector [Gammaproteobacteria bacterium]